MPSPGNRLSWLRLIMPPEEKQTSLAMPSTPLISAFTPKMFSIHLSSEAGVKIVVVIWFLQNRPTQSSGTRIPFVQLIESWCGAIWSANPPKSSHVMNMVELLQRYGFVVMELTWVAVHASPSATVSLGCSDPAPEPLIQTTEGRISVLDEVLAAASVTNCVSG